MDGRVRIAACLEYCGAGYRGWQRQGHAPSVQQAVESALGKVANHSIDVVASGRTDSGVHAVGQIVHFDTSSQRIEEQWVRGANTWLPDDISMIWTRPVSPHFHARFGARQRSYRYILLNRPVSPSYLHGRVTWHRAPLDLEPMQEAARQLVGCHDFSAFRAAGCQNRNPVKRVSLISLDRSGPWIWLDITADGFLHHMVRNIMGVLTRIGEGLKPARWAGEVLASRDRRAGGVTAPADGLYFVSVRYDQKYNLPVAPDACRFW